MRLSAGVRPAFACLLVILAFIAPAAASETGAVIRVHVQPAASRDVSAAVEVTVTALADPQRSWMVRVDPGGVATFRGLPTAVYRVTAAPTGGAAVSVEVTVRAGDVLDLETRFSSQARTLAIATLGRISQGLTFAGPTLTEVPAGNVWGLLDTAEPFVIVDRMDDGGLLTAAPGLVGSRGASWTTATLSFDESAMAGPSRTGQFGWQPDLADVEAVTVVTGLAPVDFAAPGAAISLEPKRPGTAPHGDLAVATTSGRMAGRNDQGGIPSIARLDSWSNLTGDFGGPITPRLGVYVEADTTRSEQESRAEGLQLPGNLATGFGHLVAHPGDHDELRAIGSYEGATTAFADRDQFANRDVTESDRYLFAEGVWDHVGEAGRRLVSVGFNQGTFTPDVFASTLGGTVDQVLDGPVPDPPTHVTARATTATFEFDPRDWTGAGVDHALRLGLTFDARAAASAVLDLPTVAETVDGLPARVWVATAPVRPESNRHVTDLTAYVSDQIQLASRLTADLGVRATLTSGSADGAATGVSWKTVAPRVGLKWAPRAATLYAAYGRYYTPLSLDWLAMGDPGAPTAEVFRWTDPNGDGRFESSERGPLIALAGWGQGVGSIDPALRDPYTDEVTFGAERWFGTTFHVHAAATIRHENDLAAPVNVGAPVSSYSTFTVIDQGADYFGTEDDHPLTIYNRLPSSFGQDRYLLTNPAGDTARYEGVEIVGEVRGTHLSSIVGAMAYLTRAGAASPGFTALENDQDVLGSRYLDPNAQPAEPGSVFFDRSYVLKWTTAYDGPHHIRASISARYQDGQPFTRLVVAPNLNQGPEVIQAYRVGRTRFFYTLTLDAEVAKGFQVGRHQEWQVTVNAFNLLNQATEVEENVVGGTGFRQTTAVQPPRTIRVGLRLKF